MSKADRTYFVMRDGWVIDFITDDHEEAVRERDYNNRNYQGYWTIVQRRTSDADELLREFDKIITDPERSRAYGTFAR